MKIAYRWPKLAAALLFLVAAGQARAEQSEVKILIGKPLGYLTLQVMQHDKLYEKQATVHGLPGLKVTYVTNFTGTNAVDAMLSGSVDIVQYSPDVLLTLWSKTVGTPQEIRGIVGKGSMEFVLNTRNPNVKSIRDFTEKDRISVFGVKVSATAILLQMAAEKEFGKENWEKLDSLTVTNGAPDAYAQLMSPISQITADFGVPPFTYLEQENPAVHRVLGSYDIVGEPHTSAVMFATKKFRDANPKLIAAFIDAIKEANDTIKNNREHAVDAYFAESGDTTTKRELVYKFLDDPHTGFDLAPTGIMRFADFMYEHKIISRKPDSWKDLFFPEAHGMNGS